MKILYVFPHPDDESFGPAPAIANQVRNGDEVYLLTLTKGEATKQRFKLDLSKEEMGQIRYKEMQEVAKVLDLSDLTVLDFPDNQLKELDPIELEEAVEQHILKVEPDVLVTYAVHGISGFHDHLVSHAVVKRVYCSMQRKSKRIPSRLAFFTLMDAPREDSLFDLSTSNEEEIDCILSTSDADMQKFNRALDCYETYQEVIEKSNVRDEVTNEVSFEFFQENFSPPVDSLGAQL